MDERVRGRRAVKLRRSRLETEPLCRDCGQRGRITVATVPDHIIPLALGGSDTDDNIRCLCETCHDRRTREQFGFKPPRTPTGLDGWPENINNEWDC